MPATTLTSLSANERAKQSREAIAALAAAKMAKLTPAPTPVMAAGPATPTFFLDEDERENDPESAFQTALKELDGMIFSVRPTSLTINPLLLISAENVRNAVVQVKEKNSLMPSELSTLTNILTSTKECFTYKAPAAFDTLSRISKQDDTFKSLTKSSWGKVLKGSLLVFLGAVVITASVLVAVETAGIASPLSALGIKMGVSLVTAGIAVGCAVAGAGIATVGIMHLAAASPLNESVQDLVALRKAVAPAPASPSIPAAIL